MQKVMKAEEISITAEEDRGTDKSRQDSFAIV
jgi:hypothetical protein